MYVVEILYVRSNTTGTLYRVYCWVYCCCRVGDAGEKVEWEKVIVNLIFYQIIVVDKNTKIRFNKIKGDEKTSVQIEFW